MGNETGSITSQCITKDVPQRESEIGTAYQQLVSICDLLESVVRKHEERICCILSPSFKPDEKGDEQKGLQTPLAAAIEEQARKISRIVVILNEINERIELP
jgi:hypothetical protein